MHVMMWCYTMMHCMRMMILSLVWRSSSTSVTAQVWRVAYTAWYETDQWKAQCKADAQSKIVKTWADLESRLCWSDKWWVMTLIHSPSMKSKSCDMHSLWEFKHTHSQIVDELWGSWWSEWWSKVEVDNLDHDKFDCPEEVDTLCKVSHCLLLAVGDWHEQHMSRSLVRWHEQRLTRDSWAAVSKWTRWMMSSVTAELMWWAEMMSNVDVSEISWWLHEFTVL